MDRSEYQKTYREKYKDQARRVNLTFSRSEHRDLSRAAKSQDKTLSSYVRGLALAANQGKAEASLPEEVLERLADMDRVFRTIANNVNQIAWHSHTIQQVLDEQDVLTHLFNLEKELKETLAQVQKYIPSNPGTAS